MEIGNEIKKAKYWKDMAEEFEAIVITLQNGMMMSTEMITRVKRFKKTLDEAPRNGSL